MKIQRTWNASKKPLAVGAFNLLMYKEIQWARGMSSPEPKNFLNDNLFAGSVSTLAMGVSGVSIIDNLILLSKYFDKTKLSTPQIIGLITGALFSLATMIYTGINFFDQKHTGVIGLLSFVGTLFNSFVQSTVPGGTKSTPLHSPSLTHAQL